jgi:FtsH-binding integral membrane protein
MDRTLDKTYKVLTVGFCAYAIYWVVSSFLVLQAYDYHPFSQLGLFVVYTSLFLVLMGLVFSFTAFKKTNLLWAGVLVLVIAVLVRPLVGLKLASFSPIYFAALVLLAIGFVSSKYGNHT